MKKIESFPFHARVVVGVLGKPTNWKDNSNLVKLIPILKKNGIEKVYIPDCSTFTGRVGDSLDFNCGIEIKGIKFFNEVKTEGLILEPKSASLIRTADCPTIVCRDIKRGILVAAHAGLGSVIDLSRILSGKTPRRMSVVDNIINNFDDLDNLRVNIFCGISYHNFIYSIDDPVYVDNNKKILNYLLNNFKQAVPFRYFHGGISINNIIIEQFCSHGIKPEQINIDGIDTFENLAFWSHRRAVLNKRNKSEGRNAVLVMHR